MASLYKKPIIIRNPKTAEKVKAKSRKWWRRFTDALGREKRIPLCTDKQAALAMLKDEVQKVDRQRAGLEDPVDEEMQRRRTWQSDAGKFPIEWESTNGNRRGGL